MRALKNIGWDKVKSGRNAYLFSILVLALAVIVCFPLSEGPYYYVVSFILLMVVTALSTFMPLGPLLLVCTLSAIVWNFFFIPPN